MSARHSGADHPLLPPLMPVIGVCGRCWGLVGRSMDGELETDDGTV